MCEAVVVDGGDEMLALDLTLCARQDEEDERGGEVESVYRCLSSVLTFCCADLCSSSLFFLPASSA